MALRSKHENNGKVVVGRPDSGNPKEQVLFICRLSEEHGLVEYKTINGKTWKFGTFLKFIEADGMDFETMWDIIVALMDEGFVPYNYGFGGCWCCFKTRKRRFFSHLQNPNKTKSQQNRSIPSFVLIFWIYSQKFVAFFKIAW